MEFLSEYGMFLAKAATLVVAVLVVVGGIVALVRRGEGQPEIRGRLDVRHLNETYDSMAFALKAATLPKKAFKQFQKEHKAREKQREKTERRRVFVLNFHGDIRAVAVASLREEVTAVLTAAQPEELPPNRKTKSCCGWRAPAGWFTAMGWQRRNCCGFATVG